MASNLAERVVAPDPVPGAPRVPPAAGAAPKPVLQVRNLRAGYGDKEILKDVSFTLNEDDFFAIIGP